MTSQRAILIAGPTASGKSRLAIALAERLGGVVINADSMQVYRELRILTARPPTEDEARVPHALYGHVAAAEAYSAGRYIADAARAIAEARAGGRVPIVVGGTGLYFKALLEGLSPVPPIPAEIRERWRARACEIGAAALHAELAARDPEMAARLRPSDRQRIVRALEVLEATGASLAAWQRRPGKGVLAESDAVRLVVTREREDLAQRCDARFDVMMAAGALGEVRSLQALRLDPELPIMGALGVRPLMEHLAGRMDLEGAVSEAKAESRRYAKRQMTWLRRNMITWKWLCETETERILAGDVTLIESWR